MPRPRRLLAPLAVVALAAVGCAAGSPPSPGGRLLVAVAESSWGSIAAQLGGDRVEVESIITNPDTDPHDYEPTAADGRTVAQASYVVENGLGYDPWIARLVSANRSDGQRVLDIGSMLGLRSGDNPHRWYFPGDVDRVVRRISTDYQRLDPAHAAYYRARRAAFETTGLGGYHRLLGEIAARYRGTPVGASESIFVGIAQATGLDLITPRAYLRAISEDVEPTTTDTETVHRQLASAAAKVWVVNRQNSTPDIQALTVLARTKHVPVTTITETLSPAAATFQQWQVTQLRALESALARAVGR